MQQKERKVQDNVLLEEKKAEQRSLKHPSFMCVSWNTTISPQKMLQAYFLVINEEEKIRLQQIKQPKKSVRVIAAIKFHSTTVLFHCFLSLHRSGTFSLDQKVTLDIFLGHIGALYVS